jgi:hypothetical protein
MMIVSTVRRLAPPDEQDGGKPGQRRPLVDNAQAEDLPYRVELWNPAKAMVEMVLATTASTSIGYAAYHAATVEFPDRYVVLRHHHTVLSRWNGPKH